VKTAKRQFSVVDALSLATAFFAVFLLFSAYIPYTHAGALAADVARAFSANQALVPGTIVSLTGNSSDEVEPANSANTKQQIVGVVVAKDGSLVSIDV
jgi:hypothetical protein